MDWREMLARLAELTRAEITELLTAMRAEVRALAEGDPTDEVIESLTGLREGIALAATRETELATAEAARAEQVAEILAETQVVETPEPDPAADPAAEPVEPDPNADPDAEPVVPEAVVVPEAEPLAAAARRIVSGIRVRAPEARRQPPASTEPRMTITAAADIPGVAPGAEMGSLQEVAAALVRRKQAFSGRAARGFEKVPVATLRWDYPSERMLGGDPAENQRRIEQVTGPRALAASGGLCAPVAPSYDQINVSVGDRPVRDSLAQFQATRGGVTILPSPVISDLDDALAVWTKDNDENPQNPSTKPCLHVDCPSPETCYISAITRCLEFGNFDARAWPEGVANLLELVMAAAARLGERTLLDGIAAGSTAVTFADGFGTTRAVLAALDQAQAGWRNRNRAPTVGIRTLLPAWVRSAMRTDLARQVPGDNALAVADAQLAAFFAARGLSPTWILEGESGQDFSAQNAGVLNDYPQTVVAYMFHEGAHLFLDGGTLDLGIVRDSTLNSVNDYQVFAETFEGVCTPGIEPLKISIETCATGVSQAADQITDLCPNVS